MKKWSTPECRNGILNGIFQKYRRLSRLALMFVLCMSSQLASRAQVDLNLGLAAYYPFNGNANDASGNNNNPSFNNATLVPDRLGNANSAYHFNGTDSYMKIPNSPSLNFNNKMSISVWVRPTGFYTGTCHGNSVVMKGDADYLTGNYLVRFDDNVYTSGANCSTPVVDITHQNFYGSEASSSPPGYTPYIAQNQWHHVVITHDGTTAKLYVNCELKASHAQTAGQTFTNSYDLFLGKLNAAAFPYWLNGDLDEVRIYNRAINVDEVKALGGCTPTLTCNSWLSTPSQGSYVNIGDLDISGTQVTVEAVVNRTQAYLPGTGDFNDGDIVSKHQDPTNVNYLLRPNHAYITTTNGFFATPDFCEIELNRNYHLAMVYDGSSLKLYRNGYLMSQVAATGNLFQNNFPTRIGMYTGLILENFLGYVNEVRIWNVARTEQQIRTFMNTSLPSPQTQAGLQAYYIFDNLINKQGNTTWDGTLSGAAAVNSTNPNCSLIIDSCNIAPTVTKIINDYTPVTGLDICKNILTVEDAAAYNPGDTVLLIQMKGAEINTTNTASFGSITDYRGAGNYEINYVKAKTGNDIELKNVITRSYNIPDGKVQLVRVPYYKSPAFTEVLTCKPWDGSSGGILVLNASDTIHLNANIDVTGKGFSGGRVQNTNLNATNCQQNGYAYPTPSILAAPKGESITTISNTLTSGKGPLAAAGGGGLDHNSGGGGGSNATPGGFGGYQLFECINAIFDNRGIGGKPLVYDNVQNKVFLGSGGGAGHCNNGFSSPTSNTNFDGGNGGGMVILISNYLEGNGNSIKALGDSAYELAGTGGETHDGMGGGGSGGTVLVYANNYLTSTTINVTGGKGGDMHASLAGGRIGPGGGGAGGVAWFKQAAVPAGISVINTGGKNGVLLQGGNSPHGATPGSDGANFFGLSVPVDNIPFKKNIDSVRFNETLTTCTSFDFQGLAYTNFTGIVQWHWDFGDGNTANTQNTSHNYTTAGPFQVKLVATDINGCKDSAVKEINPNASIANAGKDTAFCSNGPVTFTLHGNAGGTTYAWTPAAVLNNPALQEPTATISVSTRFYLTVTNAVLGCSAIDSVDITINPLPVVQTLGDTSFCRNVPLVLTTTPGMVSYEWTPAGSVSNPNISNPVYTDPYSQTLHVTGTDINGCKGEDIVNVTVKPVPVVSTIADTTICSTQTVTLFTTGAASYTWSPPTGLSDPTSPNPVFSGTSGQTYTVTGTAANGCSAQDVVTITVNVPVPFVQPPGKTMCSTTSVMLDGANGTGMQYAWSPGTYLSSTSIINPVANPPFTTVYDVLVTDKVCARNASFNVVVTVVDRPVVNARKSGDIDCAHRSVVLSAEGGNTYLWTPATGLSNPNSPNPVANPDHDQTYTVTVTNSANCTNTGSVTVLNKKAASLARYIPSAFTPNGDGLNDCYGIKNWQYIKKLQFLIYNRWGELVFYTTRQGACWDGNYRGKKAEEGTYVYYIKAETECGTEEQRGNVILIR